MFLYQDHGPTVSPEEAAPPIPKELLWLTQRWGDEREGAELETVVTNDAASTRARAEEEERRARYEEQEARLRTSDVWTTRDAIEDASLRAAVRARYERIYENEVSRLHDLHLDGEDASVAPSFTSVISSQGNRGRSRATDKMEETDQTDETDRIERNNSIIADLEDIRHVDFNRVTSPKDANALEEIPYDTEMDDASDAFLPEDSRGLVPRAQREEWMARARREVEIERSVESAIAGR